MKIMKKKAALVSAVAATALGASVADAATRLHMEGYQTNTGTTIRNLPVPVPPGSPAICCIPDIGPNPPGWMAPRLGFYSGFVNHAGTGGTRQGSGKPYSMELLLDLESEEVLDMRLQQTSNTFQSASGRNGAIQRAGANFTPGADFSSCVVTNPLDGDGILEIDCTVSAFTGVGRQWAKKSGPHRECMTSVPLGTTPGSGNGCGVGWSGDFTGATIAAAINPVVVVPAGGSLNPSWGGISQDPLVADGTVSAFDDATTPFAMGSPKTTDWETTTDATQQAGDRFLSDLQGVRGGGKFTISHTGADASTFAVTSMAFQMRSDIQFPTAFPATPGKAYSQQDFAFNHVTSQDAVLEGTAAKNVPAMGAFGLAALFGGLVAIAARLRRRVS